MEQFGEFEEEYSRISERWDVDEHKILLADLAGRLRKNLG
jgi:hypothetical protein